MIDGKQVRFGDKVYGSPNGSSAVYKGEYTPFNSEGGQDRFPVAIKEQTIPQNNQAFLENVMQEVIIQSKLENCEHICKCFGYYINDKKVYIVMEWLEHDLEHDMKQRNREAYPEAQLTSWMYHTLQALEYARSKVRLMQNIAHRDIKPQNILLTYERKIKLVDFGSGAITDGKVQTLTGTPLYMSPEQIPLLQDFQRTGQLPSIALNAYKCDVYSLGVTFLQMALLEPPVKLLIANRDAALMEYTGMISSNYPVLTNCLYYMLQGDPVQRPDIRQLLQYLENPGNQVALTLTPVHHIAASTVPTEQHYECAWCRQYFIQQDLSQNDGYTLCRACMANYETQKAAMSQQYPPPAAMPQQYPPQDAMPQQYPPQDAMPQQYPPPAAMSQQYPPQDAMSQQYQPPETLTDQGQPQFEGASKSQESAILQLCIHCSTNARVEGTPSGHPAFFFCPCCCSPHLVSSAT